MEPEIDLTELDDNASNLEIFALQILARVVLLEEKRFMRVSSMRVFCRMDISIFCKQDNGRHYYFVNEITWTHSAALFPQWDTNSRLNNLFSHISNILHYLANTDKWI